MDQRRAPRLGDDQQRARLRVEPFGGHHQAAAVALLQPVGAEQQIGLVALQPIQGLGLGGHSPHQLIARSGGADEQAQRHAAADGRHHAGAFQQRVAELNVAAHLRHPLAEVHGLNVLC